MKSRFLAALAIAVFAGASCSDDDNYVLPPGEDATGAYVLSEGAAFSGIGSYLGNYNLQTNSFAGDYFGFQNNGGSLGMTANDMHKYGSKLYIVMNQSNNVTVLNAADGKLIQRIDFTNSAHGTNPRYAVGANGRLYVSCSSGKVAVIDTSSLSIISGITVGSNPEQMAVANNRLFVTNSGGFNYPDYDSTVSVIDLATETEMQKITVGINPTHALSDTYGNVFIGCYGNFENAGPKIVKLSSANLETLKTINAAAGRMAVHEQLLYVAAGYAGGNKVVVYKTSNLSVQDDDFVNDGSQVATPYGIAIDNESGNVWVTDAADFQTSGRVWVFNLSGVKQFDFATTPGINPNTVVFLR